MAMRPYLGIVAKGDEPYRQKGDHNHMSLDELHARRLATVANIVESALDRLKLLLRSLEGSSEAQKPPNEPDSQFAAATGPALTTHQIQQARELMDSLRHQLRDGLERFAVRPTKPEPGQILAAELATLWVVLENARPERMKGYGRKFTPADRADWEQLVEGLLRDLEQIRSITMGDRSLTPSSERSRVK
jgi:hypothetical protein